MTQPIVGYRFPTFECSYTARDAILYALSIQCTGQHHLCFLFEDYEPFLIFPTFALVLPFRGLLGHEVIPFPPPWLATVPPQMPTVPPASLLHAEQSLLVLEPLSLQDTQVRVQSTVCGLSRLKKGYLMSTESEIIGQNNRTLAKLVSGTFIRTTEDINVSNGGCRAKLVPVPLTSEPQMRINLRISNDQAILYRLNGDYNPLHASPELADILGLSKPILHGLCTLGIAVQALVTHLGSLLPDVRHPVAQIVRRVCYLSGRFTRPVFPGDELTLEIWEGTAVPVFLELLNVTDQAQVYHFRLKKENNVLLDDGSLVLMKVPRSYL